MIRGVHSLTAASLNSMTTRRYGVKKAAFYAATKSVYSTTDVSLKYNSLFMVAGESVPHISAWVVSEKSVRCMFLDRPSDINAFPQLLDPSPAGLKHGHA